MTNPSLKLTSEGNALVTRWQIAQETLDRAQRDVRSAETEIANATNALGKWLMPPDAKKGEIVSVWFEDSMIRAEMIELHDFKVSLRYRGKEWGMRR